tara:strand:- start:239 stop:778 length:540 start_codon:yes stop_codon:yes gene_type:complete
MSTLKVNSIIPVAGVPTGGGGGIVQIKSATKTDSFSKSNVQSVDVTGLSVTITPTSTSSKIFIMYNINLASDGSFGGDCVRLVRDSTNICIGDTAGSRVSGSNAITQLMTGSQNVSYQGYSTVNFFLDSPNTTSATTYKINLFDAGANNTVVINRDLTDSDNDGRRRTASTITVMEVSA